jgi:hypothetical protein
MQAAGLSGSATDSIGCLQPACIHLRLSVHASSSIGMCSIVWFTSLY